MRANKKESLVLLHSHL